MIKKIWNKSKYYLLAVAIVAGVSFVPNHDADGATRNWKPPCHPCKDLPPGTVIIYSE